MPNIETSPRRYREHLETRLETLFIYGFWRKIDKDQEHAVLCSKPTATISICNHLLIVFYQIDF